MTPSQALALLRAAGADVSVSLHTGEPQIQLPLEPLSDREEVAALTVLSTETKVLRRLISNHPSSPAAGAPGEVAPSVEPLRPAAGGGSFAAKETL